MRFSKALMMMFTLLTVSACDGLDSGNTATTSTRQCPAGANCTPPATVGQAIQYGNGPYWCVTQSGCPMPEHATCSDQGVCTYTPCSLATATCPADHPMCDTSVSPSTCKGTVVNNTTPPTPIDGGTPRACLTAAECVTEGTVAADWLCQFKAPGCGTSNKGICVRNRDARCANDYAQYCSCNGLTRLDYRESSDCAFSQYASAGMCPVTDGGAVAPDAGVSMPDAGVSMPADAGVVADAGVASDLGWSKIEYQPHSLVGVASIELRWWSSNAVLLGSVTIDASVGSKVSFRFRNLASGEKLQLWLKDAAGNVIQYGCSFNPANPSQVGMWGTLWFYKDGPLVATAPAMDGGAAITIGGTQGPNCLTP